MDHIGIANSLTPGRNNGFLNMLKLMKLKASQLASQRFDTIPSTSTGEIDAYSIVYASILNY